MNKKEIKEWLESKYSEDWINERIDERMSEYVNDDWEDEFDSLYEAYVETGRGGIEGELFNIIIEDFAYEMGEPNNDWYFKDKYGDFDDIVYEVFPQLKN